MVFHACGLFKIDNATVLQVIFVHTWENNMPFGNSTI